MTYGEALNNGYRDSDIQFERGYVSRKCNVLDQSVKTAGGNRRGQLYVSLPCWCSSYYCYRQYLKKIDTKKEGF